MLTFARIFFFGALAAFLVVLVLVILKGKNK